MASSPSQERRPDEEEEDNDDDSDGFQSDEAPSHLPFAPPSALDDISTTVDPSHIISLIRQLLPHDARTVKHSQKTDNNNNCSVQGSETYSVDQSMIGDDKFEKTTVTTEAFDDLASHENFTDGTGERINHPFVDHQNHPASTIENGTGKEIAEEEKGGVSDDGETEHSDTKDPWEDCGCILWDLSASRNHAELMVNNFLLEVLLANLQAPKSSRATEICLGIIGNLACHDALSEVIVSKHGLIQTVVDQLFVDDSTCLAETFRLLSVSLQGSGFASWAAALLHDQVLLRILWIVGNTLSSILLERSIEFLLAVVDNQEVARILLRPLTLLDFPNLVLGLLTCELSKLKDENKLERSSILDMILRLVEALSAIDNYSQAFSSHEELIHLICGMIKSPDKIEVAGSCVSAVVIIANLLVDDQHLTSVLSQDFSILQGLFDMFPFVSDDPQARNALWCILATLLVHIEESDIKKSNLHEIMSLLLDKFHLIKEDLEGHPMQDSGEDQNLNTNEKSHEMASSLSRIAYILKKWAIDEHVTFDNGAGNRDDSLGVHRLLKYFGKHGL